MGTSRKKGKKRERKTAQDGEKEIIAFTQKGSSEPRRFLSDGPSDVIPNLQKTLKEGYLRQPVGKKTPCLTEKKEKSAGWQEKKSQPQPSSLLGRGKGWKEKNSSPGPHAEAAARE